VRQVISSGGYEKGVAVTPPAASDASFVEFVRANHLHLFRTALLLTGDAASAEDLVQDTLAKLYPRWWRVAAAGVPLAYVRVSLTNMFISGRRRRSTTEVPSDGLPDAPSIRDTSDIVTDRGYAMQLLNHLGHRQRAAVILSYFHDLDDKQIAEALGCRRGTVRSLISRGIAAMRVESQRMDAVTTLPGATT
jgi:RNA polymerase sigma-70 factor (sigma-E family)